MSTSLIRYKALRSKFLKFKERYNKSIQKGTFESLSRYQQHKIIKRLRRLYNQLRQLELNLKMGVAAGTVAFALFTGNISKAQELGPFVENPIKHPLPQGIDGNSNLEPVLVDIDNDGDLDLIWGEDAGRVELYENIGTPQRAFFIERTGLDNPFETIDAGSYSSPAFADLDGDGDQDLILGSKYNDLDFHENDAGTFLADDPTASISNVTNTTNITGNYYTRPDMVDIDGDGDIDAFVGANYAAGYDIVTFWQNDGSNNFVEQIGTANPLSNVLADPLGGIIQNAFPAFVDIDGDGDLDLFIGDEYGRFRFFANSGDENSPSFTAETTGASNPLDGFALPTTAYSVSPAFGDLDNDGDFDLVYGSSRFVTSPVFIENIGDANNPVFALPNETDDPFRSVNIGSDAAPTAMDINGDGFDDLVVGEFRETSLFYFENDQNNNLIQVEGTPNPFNGLLSSAAKYTDPAFVDIDEDGDQDLFIAVRENTGDGRVDFFRNNSGTFKAETSPIYNTVNNDNMYIGAGDIDNDGDDDVVLSLENIFSTGASFAISRNGGYGDFQVQDPTSTPPFNGQDFSVGYSGTFAPELVDLDHDGDQDIVAGLANGPSSGQLAFFENDNNVMVRQTSVNNPFDTYDFGFGSNPALIDIDNDGDFDVIIGNGNGTFSFLENQNIPPQLNSNLFMTLTFTEGDSPLILDGSIAISDRTNDPIIGGRVTIQNYITGQDVLSFKPDFGVTGVFETTGPNAGSLILVAASAVTSSQFEVVLRSVTYENTSINPDTNTRSIQFEALDFDNTNPGTNDVVTITVDVIGSGNTPPGLASENTGITLEYVQNAAAVTVDNLIEVFDNDDTELVSAGVFLTGFLDGDILEFTDQNGITGSYEEGSLTLNGTASIADYRTALRSVSFRTRNGAGTRVANFEVNDGTNTSQLYMRDINITASNSAPPNVNTTPASTQVGSTVTIDLCEIITDLDNSFEELTIEVVSILSGATTTIDNCDLIIDYANIDFEGNDVIVLRATDPDGNVDENSLNIQVESSEPGQELVIYNAVSPNGDGANDWLRIDNLSTPNTIELYNRWGDSVKSLSDYISEENTQLNDLPTGTYFYKIISPEGEYEGFIVIKK